MQKNLLSEDEPGPDKPARPGGRTHEPQLITLPLDDEPERPAEPYVISEAPPESYAETVRKSGLAWSAGIAFFASVVFMLIIGWLADLMLGSSPWGIVVGIVLGSLIGFVQFFRITSQIFKQ